ncbi:unnamed protein product [Sphagnum balticum]
MSVRIAICELEAVSPYSQSRYHDTPKKDQETHEQYRDRTWREHMHYDENGEVFIPPMSIKNALTNAAKRLGMKVVGKGQKTYGNYFASGVLVTEPVMLEQVFKKHIEEAGKYVGLGRFRPANNGFYGRFKIPDSPTGKVYWTCGGKDAFWYAFYWWDRSVDSRPGSNSGFYVRGFDWKKPQEAFDFACEQFPHIVARQKFPLDLQAENSNPTAVAAHCFRDRLSTSEIHLPWRKADQSKATPCGAHRFPTESQPCRVNFPKWRRDWVPTPDASFESERLAGVPFCQFTHLSVKLGADEGIEPALPKGK